MKQIESIEQLQTILVEVRQRHQGYVSNFYLDPIKHSVWIKNNDLFQEVEGFSVFIVRKSELFWNVFYVTTDLNSLEKDLKEMTSKYNVKMMFDIVGRKEQCAPIIEKFSNCGFHESVSLVRMTRLTEPVYADETFSQVSTATKKQASEIHSLLHKYFVAENEQIPYIEELETYAELGHILVYLENNTIIGFQIYEKNATTLYWRYWFVHPDHREKHIGSILCHRLFFESNTTKRQLLWVILTNENAKKRQEHYGFHEENMYDYVLTNK